MWYQVKYLILLMTRICIELSIIKTIQKYYDPVNLCNWLKDWCKTLHISVDGLYSMEWKPLEEVNEKRDLVIIITKNVKYNKQCLKSAKAANKLWE